MARSGIWKRTISLCPDDVEFVEKPPRQLALECPICMGILYNPHIVSCCGYHFCEECLKRVKDEGKPCPMCKENFTNLLNKSLQREINQLSVRCPQAKHNIDGKGCEWTGELGYLEEHLNIGQRYGECEYLVIGCVYGCGYSDMRNSLLSHEQTQCLKRPFSCDYCGEYESTCEDVTECHWLECKDYPVECPNSCKTRYLSRGKLPEHLKDTCELQDVPCPFFWANCSVKVQRCKLKEHMDTSHIDHLYKVCQASRSLVDSVESLSKGMENVNKEKEHMKSSLTLLQREDENNKQQLLDLNQTVIMLAEKVKKLEYENETLKQQICKMNQESKAEKEILARRSFSLESSIGVPPFMFVMDSFQKRLSENSNYMSPPFYTNIGGYRMRIKVTPFGIFFGEGTHVSLTIYIMKGVFDDFLRWPFRGSITIALLDRLEDKDHCVDTITFDNGTSIKASGRVKNGELNETGLVSYHFVDHAWLKPNSKRSLRYNPDDCLHFKVLSVTVNTDII